MDSPDSSTRADHVSMVNPNFKLTGQVYDVCMNTCQNFMQTQEYNR